MKVRAFLSYIGRLKMSEHSRRTGIAYIVDDGRVSIIGVFMVVETTRRPHSQMSRRIETRLVELVQWNAFMGLADEEIRD
jgi:hypothetical protein